MRLYRIYQVLLILFLHPFICKAQSANFTIKKYTTENGLPDVAVLTVYQDSRGFLWIGTNNGLSRFNGKNFENYGSRQGLTNLYVNQIMEDANHRLWVSTRNSVLQLSGSKFIDYPFSDLANVDYVFAIKQLRNGELWAFTNKGSYYLQKDHWQKKVFIPGYENQICRQIIETARGDYILYDNLILFKNKEGGLTELWKQVPAQQSAIYFNLIRISEDTLYVTNRDGVYKMTAEKNIQ